MSDSKFRKKFVRVEWLALQRAMELMCETKLDDLYFIGASRLVGDIGQVVFKVSDGEMLYDKEGNPAGARAVEASQYDLDQDIGEFELDLEHIRNTAEPSDEKYFLQRTYAFDVYKKGQKRSMITIWASFAKRQEGDDWKLVSESLVDNELQGDGRWLIYRKDE